MQQQPVPPIPARPPASISVARALEAAFALVAPPSASAARAFLFSDDPSVAAVVLSDNSSARSATVISCSDTAAAAPAPTSAPSPCAAPPFESVLTFQGLFVPAFITGHLSVGLLVSRSAAAIDARRSAALPAALSLTAEDFWAARPHILSIGRYVKNSRTGEVVFIKRKASHTSSPPSSSPPASSSSSSSPPPPSVVEICHIRPLNHRNRTRTILVCDSPAFAAALTRPFLDFRALAASVLTLFASRESRSCPECGGSPAETRCFCRHVAASSPPPRSIHDAHLLRRSFETNRGEYAGSSWVAAVSARPPVHAAPASAVVDAVTPHLVCRVQISAHHCAGENIDPGAPAVADLLRLFAIQLSISSRPPAALSFPSAPPWPQPRYTGGDADVAPLPAPPFVADGHHSAGAFHYSRPSSSFVEDADDAAAVLHLSRSSSRCTMLGATSERQRLLGCLSGNVDGAVCSEGLLKSEVGFLEHWDTPSALQTDTGAMRAGSASDAKDVGIAPPILEESAPIFADLTATAAGPAAPPDWSLGAALPDAPSAEVEVAKPRRKRGKLGSTLTDAEKVERAATRKAKNRAAATKANTRRKQQNDFLNYAVAVDRERIQALRIREAQLISSNAAMRDRLVSIAAQSESGRLVQH